MNSYGHPALKGPLIELAPETRRRASLTACHYAQDASDALILMRQLGLMPEPERPKKVMRNEDFVLQTLMTEAQAGKILREAVAAHPELQFRDSTAANAYLHGTHRAERTAEVRRKFKENHFQRHSEALKEASVGGPNRFLAKTGS